MKCPRSVHEDEVLAFVKGKSFFRISICQRVTLDHLIDIFLMP